MKHNCIHKRIAASLALASGLAFTVAADTIGTAITYQGLLSSGGTPANGNYFLRFKVYDAFAGGTQCGTTCSVEPQWVTNGLFTVPVDLGQVYDGAARYLEIAVAVPPLPLHPTNYITLSPRQTLTPTPYAIHAQESSGMNGLRIQTSTNGGPSVIGGSAANTVAPGVAGATIAGGGATNFGGLGFDYVNTVTASFGTVAGGGNNRSLGNFATVGGGGGNTSIGSGATVAGGSYNNVSGNNSSVSGGYANTNAGFAAVIGGGSFNTISTGSDFAVIPGGNNNSVTAPGGLAAGRDSHVSYAGSFVWGDGTRAAASAGANRFDVLATGGATFYTGAGSLTGVEGNGIATSPANTGVYGVSLDTGGNGVVGEANNGGSAYAIWGKSTSGYAGYFSGKVNVEGSATIGGTANLSAINLLSPGALNFGNGLRQMINLYNAEYGIGIQNNAQYYRSASDFYWFKGGSHSNTSADAGPGGTNLMHLDSTGTLFVKVLTITGGADVAEPFQMSDEEIGKGSVVIIDDAHPGKLKLSERAYDTRVAGIVSGANGIKPGLSLHQEGDLEGDQNVALSGRVYVQADAGNGAIEPGDLLTTSDLPGYAMKVTDHAKAQGAILGKAMTGLTEGKGLILVLVSLQ